MENEVDAPLLNVEKCVHTFTESFRSTQRQINADTIITNTQRHRDRQTNRHTHTNARTI